MVTMKRVPDVFEQKNALAQKEEKKQTYEFVQKTDHEFINYDSLAFGQKDFNLNTNVPDMENKHGLTVFDKRPKEYWDKVIRRQEREVEAEAATKNGKPHWQRAHKLPGTLTAIAQNLPDHHKTRKQGGVEATNTLEKEKWESAYTLLARTVKDDLVVGKPPFQIYLPSLKPEDKDRGFDGGKQVLKTID